MPPFIRDHMKVGQMMLIGVNPIDPRVEAPEEVCDDTMATRATALAKIRARVEGAALASQRIGA